MILDALIVTFAFYGVYGWLCGIECGLGLLRLLPRSSLTKQGLRLFTPAWELTHVFLLAGILACFTVFHAGFDTIFRAVMASLLVGLAAIILRIFLVMYMSLGTVKVGLTWLNLLFSAVSFLVPLSFGSAGVLMLTGHNFWQTTTGWFMIGSLVIGLLALAVAFVYYVVGQTPHDRLHQVSRWLNISLAVIVLSLLQLAVARHSGHLVSRPYLYFLLTTLLVLVWQVGLLVSARERYMFVLLSIFAVTTPVLLAWANWPYLLFPQGPVRTAYSPHGYGAVICLALVLLFLIFATGLLAWRLRYRVK